KGCARGLCQRRRETRPPSKPDRRGDARHCHGGAGAALPSVSRARRNHVPRWHLYVNSIGLEMETPMPTHRTAPGLFARISGRLKRKPKTDQQVTEQANITELEPTVQALPSDNIAARPCATSVPPVRHARELDADPVIAFLKECVRHAVGEESDWAEIFRAFL